jgi:hypothetical protein
LNSRVCGFLSPGASVSPSSRSYLAGFSRHETPGRLFELVGGQRLFRQPPSLESVVLVESEPLGNLCGDAARVVQEVALIERRASFLEPLVVEDESP